MRLLNREIVSLRNELESLTERVQRLEQPEGATGDYTVYPGPNDSEVFAAADRIINGK